MYPFPNALLTVAPSVVSRPYGLVAAGSAVTDFGGGTIDLPYPAGILSGDFLIMFVSGKLASGNPTITDPSGWRRFITALTTASAMFALWRRADGAEGGSISVSHNGAVTNDHWSGQIIAWGGVASSENPIGDLQMTGGSGATVTYPSVNMAAANLLKINYGYRSSAASTFGVPSGFSSDGGYSSNFPSFAVHEKQFGASGASGSQTGSVSSSGEWASASFALLTTGDANYYYYSNSTTATSTSAFAAKGLLLDIVGNCTLASVRIWFQPTASETYRIVLAVVDTTSNQITSIVESTSTQTVSSSGDYTFTFGSPHAFTAGQRIAVIAVRTDGTATSPCHVYYASAPGATGLELTYYGGIRYASTAPAIGDSVLFDQGSSVQLMIKYSL